MLELPGHVVDDIVALAKEEYPYESCGLLAGPAGGDTATQFYRCRNAAESARVYTVHPQDHLYAERDAEENQDQRQIRAQLHAERDAEARGWEIIGVVHSHTHTPAYPSPTDVAQAPDPAWHYAIVSLQRDEPSMRSFRIEAEQVTEEVLSVT